MDRLIVGKRIDVADEIHSMNDLTGAWKIVAKVYGQTWIWFGELKQAKENAEFHRLAFPPERGKQPHISCVTGRDVAGQLTLYARIFPVQFRTA